MTTCVFVEDDGMRVLREIDSSLPAYWRIPRSMPRSIVWHDTLSTQLSPYTYNEYAFAGRMFNNTPLYCITGLKIEHAQSVLLATPLDPIEEVEALCKHRLQEFIQTVNVVVVVDRKEGWHTTPELRAQNLNEYRVEALVAVRT